MFSFVAGAVRRDSMVYLAMVGDQTAKLRVPEAHFVMWHEGKWLNAEGRHWDVAGLAVAKQPLELHLGQERARRCRHRRG